MNAPAHNRRSARLRGPRLRIELEGVAAAQTRSTIAAGDRSWWLATAVLLCVLIAPVGADEPAPLPPLPEDVLLDPAVQAVSVEEAVSAPLPLRRSPAAAAPAGRSGVAGPLGDWTVLAAIVAAFALLVVFRFQQSRRRGRMLPPDVFEVLGETSLGGQHGVRVVRFGPRTLLVGVSGSGCQTLATIDDPQATERIVAACLGARLPLRPARFAGRSAPSAAARGEPAGGEAV